MGAAETRRGRRGGELYHAGIGLVRGIPIAVDSRIVHDEVHYLFRVLHVDVSVAWH